MRNLSHKIKIHSRRIGILSDAHGNGAAFDRAVLILKENRAEEFWYLGDSIDYPNFRLHEFKAWQELVNSDELNYRYIGYTEITVAIEIL